MNAFETYETFNAIRLHFNEGHYDFFKYRGKTRSNAQNFQTRKDSWQYDKLSRKYSADQLIGLFATAFRDNTTIWPNMLLTEKEHHQKLVAKERFEGAPEYFFKEEVEKLFEIAGGKEAAFRKNENGIPNAFHIAVIEHGISIETYTVLDRFLELNKQIDPDLPGIGSLAKRVENYAPFVKYNPNVLKKILAGCLKDA